MKLVCCSEHRDTLPRRETQRMPSPRSSGYVRARLFSLRSNSGTAANIYFPANHDKRQLQKPTASRTIRPMRSLLVMISLVGCGGGGNPAIDAAPVALDCPTYCAEVQANCTGANAQYPDMAHCMATCASFTVGTSTVTDTSGNTLGCRIHYAGAPSMTAPATDCVHAGPAGDLITATPPAFCSGGDVCASFCILEIKACGTLDAPLPGNPRQPDGNPIFQYRNMDDCMASCAAFDKTHEYGTTAVGDSLACRLFYATSAAISVTPDAIMYCPYTAPAPTGACAGTATP